MPAVLVAVILLWLLPAAAILMKMQDQEGGASAMPATPNYQAPQRPQRREWFRAIENHSTNHSTTPADIQFFRELSRRMAEHHGIDPWLVEIIIRVESGWNPRAVSKKGAQGLMQLMPETAAKLGVRNSFDPQENIEGGVRHLRNLLDEFDLRLALAAYNAGALAVRQYNGVPPYPETQEYVRRVMSEYSHQRG